jgi:hypothetical protein
MNKNSILIFISLFLLTCDNNTKTKLNKTEPKISSFATTYNKIEFYCFAMCEADFNNRAVLVGVAGEKGEVAPNKLISKEHYYDSIYDKEKIDKFSKLFFSPVRKITAQPSYPNARFVMLLKSNTAKTDTIFWNVTKIPSDTAILNLNQKYLIVYPFNIMDSIRNIMGRKVICCDFKAFETN